MVMELPYFGDEELKNLDVIVNNKHLIVYGRAKDVRGNEIEKYYCYPWRKTPAFMDWDLKKMKKCVAKATISTRNATTTLALPTSVD